MRVRSFRLGHVRWLGGSSGAGKTTVASILARHYGLRIYSTDSAIAPHGSQPGSDAPLLGQFRDMTMDERWLTAGSATMHAKFPWFAGERFDRVVSDLRGMPSEPLILAEGFRLLPRLVAPLLAQPWQAVWFVSSSEFRRRAFQRRRREQQFWLRTSDPVVAFERLLERDAMFADGVVRDAERLQLKIIRVDGDRSEDAVAEETAHWLRLTSL